MGFFERTNSPFNRSQFMANQLNSTNELNCLLCSKHGIVGNIREEQDKALTLEEPCLAGKAVVWGRTVGW